MSISGTITLAVNMNDQRAIGINPSANIPANFSPSISFANGVGAGQVNQLFQAQIALVAGAYNFDLNGALTDSFGSSLALVRVKGISIQNNSATNSMTFGNGSNPWVTLLTGTGTIILPPGAAFAAFTPDATGWAVTASTGDILKVAGTGTDAFTIILCGGLS